MSTNETSVPSAPPAPDSASEGSTLRHRVTEASSESTGFTSFPGPSSSSSSSSQQQSTNRQQNQENNGDNGSFECNICLDTAKDAVVSLCGHLFCWPCLHQWLETKPNRQVCPVCKAAISRDKVVPLYGRGSSRQDPRDKLPPRPPGQRTEPEYSSANFPGFGFGDGGIHMSFGIGAFPFGFFASTFNFNDARGHLNMNEQQPEDIFISRIFLWIALFFILWLLFA